MIIVVLAPIWGLDPYKKDEIARQTFWKEPPKRLKDPGLVGVDENVFHLLELPILKQQLISCDIVSAQYERYLKHSRYGPFEAEYPAQAQAGPSRPFLFI